MWVQKAGLLPVPAASEVLPAHRTVASQAPCALYSCCTAQRKGSLLLRPTASTKGFASMTFACKSQADGFRSNMHKRWVHPKCAPAWCSWRTCQSQSPPAQPAPHAGPYTHSKRACECPATLCRPQAGPAGHSFAPGFAEARSDEASMLCVHTKWGEGFLAEEQCSEVLCVPGTESTFNRQALH